MRKREKEKEKEKDKDSDRERNYIYVIYVKLIQLLKVRNYSYQKNYRNTEEIMISPRLLTRKNNKKINKKMKNNKKKQIKNRDRKKENLFN